MADQLTILPDTPENRELTAHVHPAEWINPEPGGRYNLVVIGAGTAGLVSAAGAAGLGARVALVERYLMGGDCLNVGCVPSKGIIRAARAAHDVRQAGEFGVQATQAPPPTSAQRCTGCARFGRSSACTTRPDAFVMNWGSTFLSATAGLSAPIASRWTARDCSFGKLPSAPGHGPPPRPFPACRKQATSPTKPSFHSLNCRGGSR